MRSHRHFTVFAPEYLDRLRAEYLDDPCIWEAEHAGPWRVAECRPAGFSVARSPALTKDAVFDHRETALLVAAIYPRIGRDARSRLAKRSHSDGYDVVEIFRRRRAVHRLARLQPSRDPSRPPLRGKHPPGIPAILG